MGIMDWIRGRSDEPAKIAPAEQQPKPLAPKAPRRREPSVSDLPVAISGFEPLKKEDIGLEGKIAGLEEQYSSPDPRMATPTYLVFDTRAGAVLNRKTGTFQAEITLDCAIPSTDAEPMRDFVYDDDSLTPSKFDAVEFSDVDLNVKGYADGSFDVSVMMRHKLPGMKDQLIEREMAADEEALVRVIEEFREKYEQDRPTLASSRLAVLPEPNPADDIEITSLSDETMSALDLADENRFRWRDMVVAREEAALQAEFEARGGPDYA